MEEKKFVSNQSNHQSLNQHIFLEKKRLDLEMLKVSNQNREFCHVMKRTRIFSGPEEFFTPRVIINQPSHLKRQHL